MEPKFKIGDKVRIIRDCSYIFVDEKDGALGMVGVVVKVCSGTISYPTSYVVKSDEFNNDSNRWDFYEEGLELVDENITSVSISTNNKCPKCSSEMIKKQTDQYGLIDKCLNCGYC